MDALKDFWSKQKRGRMPATHITTACPINPHRLFIEVHSWGGMEKVGGLGLGGLGEGEGAV